MLTGDRGSERFSIFAHDFSVGRQQNDLMACVGVLAFRKTVAVRVVQSAQRGVHNQWDLPTRRIRESPDHGRGDQLAFAGGQIVELDSVVLIVQQFRGEGLGVDVELGHQVIFAEQLAAAIFNMAFDHFEVVGQQESLEFRDAGFRGFDRI